jgi:hypothetical protein
MSLAESILEPMWAPRRYYAGQDFFSAVLVICEGAYNVQGIAAGSPLVKVREITNQHYSSRRELFIAALVPLYLSIKVACDLRDILHNFDYVLAQGALPFQ